MNSQVPGEPVSLAECQEDQSMPMNIEAAEDNIFHVMTIETAENLTWERL